MSDINVTPLVDVMLVLLVIFMVTAPLLTVGVQVDLPKTRAAAVPPKREPIRGQHRPNGAAVFLDSELVTLDTILPRLRAHAVPRLRATSVFVRGDQGIPYGQVMSVIGAMPPPASARWRC